MSHCSFYHNSSVWFLWTYEGSGTQDVSNCYWDTADSTEIARKIYDLWDVPSLKLANFSPFLLTPYPPPDSVIKIEIYTDSEYSTPLADNPQLGDSLFVELAGVDPADTTLNITSVTVTSSVTDTGGIKVVLEETGINTGIYRGKFYISQSSDNVYDRIGVGSEDQDITIIADADTSKKVVFQYVVPTSVKDAISAEALPEEYILFQNYPNPFNPETTIQFALPEESFVTLQVYNIAGQLIRTLKSEKLPAGYYRVCWDGKDDNGREMSSGVYFYRIVAGEFTQAKRMILLK